MNFELNREQKEVVKAAWEFARGEFDPDLCLEIDRKCRFPAELRRKAGSLGFIAPHFPEKFSGQDIGIAGCVLIIETMCRRDSTAGCTLALSSYGSESLLLCGVDDLKAEYLPAVAEGSLVCGGMLSGMLKSRESGNLPLVERQGSGFVLNGRCASVVNSGGADIYFIPCLMKDEGSADGTVYTALVEKGREGFSAADETRAMGLRTASFSDLEFENCQLPAEFVFYQALERTELPGLFLQQGWVLLAAAALGIAQGAYDRARDYTEKREQFGKKISRFQVIQHRLADMASAVHNARLSVYQAASCLDRGDADPRLPAMARLAACRAAVEVSYHSVQLLGGYGYMSEYQVERFYRDAKMLEICDCTPDTLKDVIFRRL